MLGVIGKEGPPEAEHLGDPVVGDPVVDRPVLAPGKHEAAPTQAGEVLGGFRLGQLESLGQFSNRELLRLEGGDQTQAGGIAEGPEVLGDEIEWSRLLIDSKRRDTERRAHIPNLAYE